MKIDEMILVIDALPDREYPQGQLSLAVDVADKSEKSGVDSLFLNKKAEEICLESISIYEFVIFLKRDAFLYFLKPILKSICMYPESNMSSLVNGFLFMRLKKKEVSRVSEIIDELSIKELEAINNLIEYVASNANVSDIRIEYTKSLDRIRSMN